MRFETPGRGVCGPVAVYNVLLALGDRPSLKKLRADAGTNPVDGTDSHGLKQAIERAGHTWAEVAQSGFEQAYAGLHDHLVEGGGAILLTEEGDHWEAAIGVLGPRVVIFNSDRAENPDNRAANGVNVLTKRQLVTYWEPYKGQRYALLIR